MLKRQGHYQTNVLIHPEEVREIEFLFHRREAIVDLPEGGPLGFLVLPPDMKLS